MRTPPSWQIPFLGLRQFPRSLTLFELATFFSFNDEERGATQSKRGDHRRLAFGIHLGFLKMAGTTLSAVDRIPSFVLSRSPMNWIYLTSTSPPFDHFVEGENAPCMNIGNGRCVFQERALIPKSGRQDGAFSVFLSAAQPGTPTSREGVDRLPAICTLRPFQLRFDLLWRAN